MDYVFIAVDPGSKKCGFAVMSSGGEVLDKLVSPAAGVADAAMELARRFPNVDRIVVGAGTGSKQVVEKLKSAAGLPARLEMVEEKNTTLDARLLYERDHPLPWPLRLFPRWLFAKPSDMDAYAAAAIGAVYLGVKRGEG